MQTSGVNSVCGRLAATTGLLLFLAANAAGADSLVADAATAAASQTLPSDVAATEVDVSVSAAQNRATTGDKPVAQVDDTGAFLGQLVARYFESYK